MLHWLAGKQPSDGTNADPDPTAYIEPPETPAPVFAVRAFKHAIFGTPGTEKPKAPRRHSNTENARNGAGVRPRMVRPKSSSDATTLGRFEEIVAPPSPTKGILMTPGTAAGKRKTVTFPDHVLDNEGKRPLKSGLPDDCPGKFPSPWNQPMAESEHVEVATEKSRGRGKLTEALEQARDESVKRKVRLGKPGRQQDKSQEDHDRTVDLDEPKSESGKYWKHEYDIYRERTTREVKKLVAKQKAAKNFAREKDDECLVLKDELKQETKRAEKLEKRALELEKQLEGLQEELKATKKAEQDAQTELDQLKKGFGTMSYRRAAESTNSTVQASKSESERRPWRAANVQPPPVPAHTTVLANSNVAQEPIAKSIEQDVVPTRQRRRPRDNQKNPEDDIWVPSSSLNAYKADVAPPPPKACQNEPNSTSATPLQSLSINTQSQDTMSVAMSMGMQPPSPQREERQDSPLAPQDRTSFTPEPTKPEDQTNISIIIPESSPLNADATTDKALPSPLAQKSAQKAAMKPVESKENISPTRPRSKDDEQKPTAAWNAMSGPIEQRRVANRTSKEVSADALAKARERLRNGGRKVS